MPIIKIPSPLQSYVGNNKSLRLDGSTIEEVIFNLMKTYPGLKSQILDPEGNFRSFISIFLNEININYITDGIKSLVNEDDQIVIVASMAGG